MDQGTQGASTIWVPSSSVSTGMSAAFTCW
jgi:hypothetical protein